MRKGITVSIRLLAIIMILLAGSAHAQTKATTDPAVFKKIDDYINYQMKTYRIPGLALAIVQGDKITYMRGYGLASPSGEAVTPQTAFITGSTGKSVTATAVMMLVDAGKIDLDTAVQHYLPWFRLADTDASAKITVRMLLNHTSGIPEGTGWASQAYSDVSDDALEEQVRSFRTAKLNHAPGTAYEYANANYQVAGMIVQAVTGQSFQSFIQQKIYEPLEMVNSYTSRDEARRNNLAVGYRYWFGFPLAAYNQPYSYKQFPAGWYICSVEDLAHYLIMHMNDGVYAGKRLVSSEGMKTLHHPVLADYAMGWVVEGNLVSHNGATPDYGTGLYFDTATHYGVVVAFNANTGYFYTPSYVIPNSVLHLLRGTQPIPPVPDAWYRAMLIGLGLTLSLQLIWLVASFTLIRRWSMDRKKLPQYLAGKLVWLILPLLVELGLAYYILSTLQMNGRTVFVGYVYQPDLTLLAMISLCLALGWGLARTVLSVRLMLKPSI